MYVQFIPGISIIVSWRALLYLRCWRTVARHAVRLVCRDGRPTRRTLATGVALVPAQAGGLQRMTPGWAWHRHSLPPAL